MAICTPPHVRHALAREALDAGKHVMLEKPPAATLAEMHDLTAAAKAAGRVMLATWHSRYNAAVDEAKARLAGKRLKRLAIEWKEDVRRWHPGQDWIWDAGNFGVFDPGINALSILTKIAPAPFFVKSAKLLYPENRDTPIAASLVFTSPAAATGAPLSAEFDWRQEGEQSWNIDIETEDGAALRLTHGGSRLLVDGAAAVEAPMREYEGIYAHFAAASAGRGERDGLQPVPARRRRLSRRLAPDRRAVRLVSAVEIHGYAVVSRDDRIADASGRMPEALRNEADWAYFQAELDLAEWVALGRRSHEAAENLRRRRRLIVSGGAQGLEERADGWWWRPDAVPFAEVAARLMPQGGRFGDAGRTGRIRAVSRSRLRRLPSRPRRRRAASGRARNFRGRRKRQRDAAARRAHARADALARRTGARVATALRARPIRRASRVGRVHRRGGEATKQSTPPRPRRRASVTQRLDRRHYIRR